MRIQRHKTKAIKIGNVCIGGDNPVAIQSMTKTKTSDALGTIRQIQELEEAGCEIVRLAVKDRDDAKAIKKIRPKSPLALVADIHFDWRLAIEAIDNGVDKIRLNPGNIYKKDQVRQVARAANLAHVPIRIGVNSGSLSKRNARCPMPDTITGLMVKSALDYVKTLEGFGFYNIVVSLKASSVSETMQAYRSIAKQCAYPLHLGVTATGGTQSGQIKSAIAIGALLLEGIGDTIRVSLTDKPQEEVRVARAILEAVGLRYFTPEIISCPTCGRCEVDLVKIVKELEEKFTDVKYTKGCNNRLKVAIMGCVVNGPGEAREADIGIAFGKSKGIFFKKGKIVDTLNGALPFAQVSTKIDAALK